MGNKKKSQNALTDHHIIPSSKGGDDSDFNIARVPNKKHELYHSLFENKTPQEIVRYLNEKFWNNRYDIEVWNS